MRMVAIGMLYWNKYSYCCHCE